MDFYHYFIFHSYKLFYLLTCEVRYTNKENLPFSPSHITTQENDKLEAIKKFSQIEERISPAEQRINSQNVALL